MNKGKIDRLNRLAPIIDGKRIAKNIRLYDNGGKTSDRCTAVFTGNYKGRTQCSYVAFNHVPHSPNMGFWMHGEDRNIIDKPTYSHLGKKIKFSDLPVECKKLLMDEYCDLWDLPKTIVNEV